MKLKKSSMWAFLDTPAQPVKEQSKTPDKTSARRADKDSTGEKPINHGRHWLSGEIKYLKEHPLRRDAEKTAKHLGRTRYAVLGMLQRLNLAETYEFWTSKQEETLKKFYHIYRPSYLSKILGKTKEQIKSKAYYLKLRMNKDD